MNHISEFEVTNIQNEGEGAGATIKPPLRTSASHIGVLGFLRVSKWRLKYICTFHSPRRHSQSSRFLASARLSTGACKDLGSESIDFFFLVLPLSFLCYYSFSVYSCSCFYRLKFMVFKLLLSSWWLLLLLFERQRARAGPNSSQEQGPRSWAIFSSPPPGVSVRCWLKSWGLS